MNWYGIHNDTAEKLKENNGITYMGMAIMDTNGYDGFDQAKQVVESLGIASAIIKISSRFDPEVSETIKPDALPELTGVHEFNKQVIEEFGHPYEPMDLVTFSVIAPLGELLKAGVDVTHPENIESELDTLEILAKQENDRDSAVDRLRKRRDRDPGQHQME
jgi:hypothetical protein